ncbi:MAG: hypothetical protein LBS35_08475 [Synergistaceae bacterium]|jgi:hypothetical protein|nr:hypothetical protein [Synergistaceae bacterium]
MPATQTVDKETLCQKILRLPDGDARQVSDFIDSLEDRKPNEETLEACRELREGRGIKFTSAEEMFTDMGFADAYARSIGKI